MRVALSMPLPLPLPLPMPMPTLRLPRLASRPYLPSLLPNLPIYLPIHGSVPYRTVPTVPTLPFLSLPGLALPYLPYSYFLFDGSYFYFFDSTHLT